MSVWIYTDADNTLWDTNAVFSEAQLALLELAEQLFGVEYGRSDRLEFVREFDQAIAISHHSGLRYPPALLVRALGEGLAGSSPKDAVQRVLIQGSVPSELEAAALSTYAGILTRVPSILPGVREGLICAQEHGAPVYVVTEGSAESLRVRLRALALEPLISGSLSAAKTVDLYVRMKQRAAPRTAFMIGDQPDRDIRLPYEAGLKTILVLGGFRPRWIQSDDATFADAVVPTFLDAIRWVVGQVHEKRD